MEDIAIYAPGNSSLFIYLFFVLSSTTRESSSSMLPPALTDNPSKVDLATLSISPFILLMQYLGAEFFNQKFNLLIGQVLQKKLEKIKELINM